MRAAIVHPPTPGVTIADVPVPRVGPGEVRVSVLECGICGTDLDIVAGRYGTAPAGSPFLILGHENVGEVVEVGNGVAGFAPGDLVVATVRRGCGLCRFCAANRSDYCETGQYTERGIRGAPGYIAEQYVERPEYLVHVPEPLRSIAVLHEPLSVVEKAVMVGQQVLDRKEPTVGQPRTRTPSALVTGTGAIGMLAAMILRVRGYEVTGIDRHDAPSLASDLLARIGGRHINASAGISALGGAHYDLIIEASGAIALDFDLVRTLRPNGVLVLTGIPDAAAPPTPVQGGAMLREMVLSNEAIVGSVNANRTYFEAGTRDLAVFDQRWPGLAAAMISRRIPLSQAPQALTERTGGPVKVVITVRDGIA
ncbi:MAG: glucose 1-dehydrogenase [Thermoplasmata archaeon]|jgi:threonine dehydrogenase-like Zn-dependent dehydrogenase